MSFAEHVGLEILSHGDGAAHLRASVKKEHLNMHGGAHGGFLYSLADEAFALASNSREGRAVALSTNMEYLAVVREGEVLEATASEEHLGRRVARYRIVITREGEPVALFHGTVYRMGERK